jgi:hypothetical protein
VSRPISLESLLLASTFLDRAKVSSLNSQSFLGVTRKRVRKSSQARIHSILRNRLTTRSRGRREARGSKEEEGE